VGVLVPLPDVQAEPLGSGLLNAGPATVEAEVADFNTRSSKPPIPIMNIECMIKLTVIIVRKSYGSRCVLWQIYPKKFKLLFGLRPRMPDPVPESALEPSVYQITVCSGNFGSLVLHWSWSIMTLKALE
jgi:hypothetical protein